jgi:hypothetical protein
MLEARNFSKFRLNVHHRLCTDDLSSVAESIASNKHNSPMFPYLVHLYRNLRNAQLEDLLRAYPDLERLALLHSPDAESVVALESTLGDRVCFGYIVHY